MVQAPSQLFGGAQRGLGSSALLATASNGRAWYVNASAGSDSASGANPRQAFATLQAAVDAASAGDTIWLTGFTDESVTITHDKNNLWIIGVGGRGAAGIAPTTAAANGLENRAPDVTLVNVGVAAADTSATYALRNFGNRFRAFGCKIENGATSFINQVPTIAQRATGDYVGTASDVMIDDCEFAWGTNGLSLNASDYGAVTEFFIRGSKFHNITTNQVMENVTPGGGSAAVSYADLLITNCNFLKDESNTAPTKYITLAGSNANSGVVSGCVFPQAVNGGKVTLSTALLAVGDYYTGGIGTAQPS